MKERSLEFGLLKTSFGMSKRFDAFLKPLSIYVPTKNEKTESSVYAIATVYKVSKRRAKDYYKLISILDKSKLVELRRSVGIE